MTISELEETLKEEARLFLSRARGLRGPHTEDLFARRVYIGPEDVHVENYPRRPLAVFNPGAVLEGEVVHLFPRLVFEYYSYASAIGNWSRPITGDFAVDLADLKVLIPRMQRTGTKFVRTMSWVRGDVSEDIWRDEGVRRYQEMAKLAADGGIMLLHENCEGWGGLSGTHARRFIESVDHPSVRYLFDIGNTVSYGQETMPFYREILPYVEYVHIKDCRRNPAGGKSSAFTYAGEGDALVREILTDLIRNGYKAGVSIEPHVASIVHLGEGTKASPQERFDSYVRYGQGLEKLLAEIQAR